jgi:hypothetical protein
MDRLRRRVPCGNPSLVTQAETNSARWATYNADMDVGSDLLSREGTLR